MIIPVLIAASLFDCDLYPYPRAEQEQPVTIVKEEVVAPRQELSYISHRDGTTSSVYTYSTGLIMVVSPDGTTKCYIDAGSGQIMECH